jgi:5'-nucleotidase
MIILVDMDGTVTNLEKLMWARAAEQLGPDVLPAKRLRYEFEDEFSPELCNVLNRIQRSKGFYFDMEPIPGAIEALNQMRAFGHDVFICTSPLRVYEYCVTEKYAWVDKHLGKDWVRRLILAKDKTLIQGNALIDDKPDVGGVVIPTWEHILYCQRYNAHVPNKRRLTWENWQEVLRLPKVH